MAKRRTFVFDGLGVSGGVVIGPAYVFENQGLNIESHHLPPEEVEQEVNRFLEAVQKAIGEVQELGRQVAEHLDAQQAAIFEAHVALLSDPLLIEQTIKGIRENHRNAEAVFWTTAKDIGNQLKALGDPYFSERSHDLFDVARRVLKFLQEIKHPSGGTMPEGSIIVATDLGPSETALLHRDRIAAFITDAGGATSHAAIMAKALGLPAVLGLDFATHYIRSGDKLIVDGSEGKVILNPSFEQITYYEQRARDFYAQRETLSEIRSLPAVTLDGVFITLEANIEFTDEITTLLNQGAEGIGLFRTEYLFIERRSLPSEEEQEAAYRQVVEAMESRPVVFRTLDVGGDKLSDSIPTPPEGNPFLGLRAIRLCLAYPELFRCQLRPMMRATRGTTLNVLLPMISGVDEVLQAKRIIEDVHNELREAGEVLPSDIRIGAMIEIPSAAIQADAIAAEVDFFSIGTNDLTQYTLAVDRVNKLVGGLYQETHPALLRLIASVIETGRRTDTPVTVCGEMAGDPFMSLLLVGLGVRTLSMSAGLMGPVKKAIRGIEAGYLENLAKDLLSLNTPGAVREKLVQSILEYSSPPCGTSQNEEQDIHAAGHDSHSG